MRAYQLHGPSCKSPSDTLLNIVARNLTYANRSTALRKPTATAGPSTSSSPRLSSTLTPPRIRPLATTPSMYWFSQSSTYLLVSLGTDHVQHFHQVLLVHYPWAQGPWLQDVGVSFGFHILSFISVVLIHGNSLPNCQGNVLHVPASNIDAKWFMRDFSRAKPGWSNRIESLKCYRMNAAGGPA